MNDTLKQLLLDWSLKNHLKLIILLVFLYIVFYLIIIFKKSIVF